jgi:MFS family permease
VNGLGDKRSYYRLFSGYVLALLGTGVATVALALLAYDLAAGDAAAVIGTALALKMAAYVVGAPLAAAALSGLPRRPLMVGLDLVRAAAILLLPFVTAVWQLYALVFAFTLAAAAFTPAYQASVPALLTDPRAYATSLARSRIAGEVEGAVSPMLAAGLLAVLSLRDVFLAAMAAFLVSALLVATARLPAQEAPEEGPLRRLAAGFAALFGLPALRGLVPLGLAAAAAGAMVLVNTVPLVRGTLGLSREAAAAALAVFGLGAVAGAVWMAQLLARLPERAVMLAGGGLMAGALALGTKADHYPTLLALWFVIGLGTALAQGPAAALIRRVCDPADHQTVYAAQFAVGAASAGLGYAAAGWLGSTLTPTATFAVLAAVAAAGTALAAALWPGTGRTAP